MLARTPKSQAVIQLEALVAPRVQALPCPCCNCLPEIESGFHGQVVVFCDNSDCSGYTEKQAMGKTAAEAIALWNEREAV